MVIDLSILKYNFSKKPLLIGGMAMEYYGLRKSGKDIDFVVCFQDFVHLAKQFPNWMKNLGGDLGVCPYHFEIWKTICYFTYDELNTNSIEMEHFRIISLEKLLFLKGLAYRKEKYLADFKLVVHKILHHQSLKRAKITNENENLLSQLSNLQYIEIKE